MQTFLPYPNFNATAKCLDNKRLGKQRVECLQILRALSGESKGWINHPAVKMWKGHEVLLGVYASAIIEEWKSRGFKDTCYEKIWKLIDTHWPHLKEAISYPSWYGNEEFHNSHKSNLLRKDPIHYNKFGWTVPYDLPYIWPTEDK